MVWPILGTIAFGCAWGYASFHVVTRAIAGCAFEISGSRFRALGGGGFEHSAEPLPCTGRWCCAPSSILRHDRPSASEGDR